MRHSLYASRWLPFVIGLGLSLIAVLAAIKLGDGASEQARLAARWTARAGLPLFLVAYLARPLAQLKPGPKIRAVLRRRRQWGLAFAACHTIHFVALVIALRETGESRSIPVLIGGGLAYALVWAAALTSNNAAQRVMGKGWTWLHLVMIHYVWLIFFQSYAGRLFDSERILTGLVFTPILIAAAAIRYVAWERKRNRTLSTGR